LLAEPDTNQCERFDTLTVTVHNSLALQYGADPTTASIRHFWGRDMHGAPASFFEPAAGEEGWYWMGGVTVLQGHALVFLMHARATQQQTGNAADSSCAGLDFEMLGWSARMARITHETPDRWQWRTVNLPQDTHWQQILVGSSTVSAEGDYLYAWSAGPSVYGGNPIYLARWPVAEVMSGDLSAPQWYTGSSAWQSQAALGGNPPTAIVADGNNEISVAQSVFSEAGNGWWWLQSSYITNSPLCYRSGSSPVEFGACRTLLEPPELAAYPDSSLLVYAAKFHPALAGAGKGTAIGTYVVNSCNLREIRDKCDLYYPRFIRLRLEQR
jgi:hypothetical protein